VLAPPPETADRRTAAEKRHDEKMVEREGEKTRKMAMKSHRERVNDFNAALEQLSEHHDIPRVRGGLHTVTWDSNDAQLASCCIHFCVLARRKQVPAVLWRGHCMLLGLSTCMPNDVWSCAMQVGPG
jgi:hypothetical protein